ncbi:MAG: outer membrane protein assembly factor BamB [Pseudomonadota bacterium]|jgi:outer membrane protein assembly factor BamB
MLATLFATALTAKLALAAAAPTGAEPTPANSGRPFQLGFWSLNPKLDRQKPLAALDPAGFTINSGVLVGAFGDEWIGGMPLATKRVQWWIDAKSTLTAPPGSFGGSVVLGFRDGKLTRVDAVSGKRFWTSDLDSFTERPLLLNGTTLYVVTAAQVLYAIDFQTGKTLWVYDGGFPDGLSIRAAAKPVAFDNKVIFGTASGELIAVTAETGKLAWRFNPAYTTARFHDYVGEMVVRSGKLIVARYDGLVAAIDLAGSQRNILWQEKLPGITASAYRGDKYFVGALNGDVYALDPDNAGRRIWRQMTGTSVTNLTVGEKDVFAAGTGGRITALDSNSGKISWYDRLGSAIAGSPLIYEDALYYTTGMKALYAYKLR